MRTAVSHIVAAIATVVLVWGAAHMLFHLDSLDAAALGVGVIVGRVIALTGRALVGRARRRTTPPVQAG